jgi:hypothetical protein
MHRREFWHDRIFHARAERIGGRASPWSASIVGNVARNLVQGIIRGLRTRNRQDLAIGPKAEESFPARRAAVCRKRKQPLQPQERSLLHAGPRNRLQIEVPAVRAMRIKGMPDRNAPGVKPAVARPAPPGAQLRQRQEPIKHTLPARTKALVAPATRADQRRRPLAAGDGGYFKPRKQCKPVSIACFDL